MGDQLDDFAIAINELQQTLTDAEVLFAKLRVTQGLTTDHFMLSQAEKLLGTAFWLAAKGISPYDMHRREVGVT